MAPFDGWGDGEEFSTKGGRPFVAEIFAATGSRKNAVARVWLTPGSGKMTVNGRELGAYFMRPTSVMLIEQPFEVAGVAGKYDVMVRVKGGGLSGQAGAVRHGIARAIVLSDASLRKPLKKAGFLTRDSRMTERKKYGLAGARKRYQFSKR